MLDRLGRFLVEITDAPSGRISLILILALLAGVFEWTIHDLIQYFAPEPNIARILDSSTIAFLIAAITWIEIQAVQQRRRKVLEDMRVVSELNHHVRNALQVIQYASRVPEAKQQVQIIDESVERIDATLKELFPTIDRKDKP
jgi:hypothetical protein